jgi:hypothetical protein
LADRDGTAISGNRGLRDGLGVCEYGPILNDDGRMRCELSFVGFIEKADMSAML